MARKIAIVDDEEAQTALLARMVGGWAARRREPVEIERFPSAEAFQFAWAGDRGFSLLLLDIQLDGISGMALARELRRDGEALPIVFITGVADYLEEGYDVAALHYLLKPVREEKLFACLDRALRQEEREPSLLLPAQDGMVRLLQREILYAEAFAHTVALHLENRVLELRMGFGELEQALEPGWFVRCHRSYLAGLRYVARVGKTELTLDDGSALPVSRRLFPEVTRAFVRFYREDEA